MAALLPPQAPRAATPFTPANVLAARRDELRALRLAEEAELQRRRAANEAVDVMRAAERVLERLSEPLMQVRKFRA